MNGASQSGTDPRPRNQHGQYRSGAQVGPQDMNRAYGFRTRVLGRLLNRRGKRHPEIVTPQDIQRLQQMAAGAAREVVELEKYGLGTKDEYPCGPCGPNAGTTEAVVRFPRLHIEGTRELPLPKSGRAVVEYRVRSKESRDDFEGNERHSQGLEISSIEPIEEEAEVVAADDLPGKARQLAARVARVVELNVGSVYAPVLEQEKLRRGAARELREALRALRGQGSAVTRNNLARQLAAKKMTPAMLKAARMAKRFESVAPKIELARRGSQVREERGWVTALDPAGNRRRIGKARGRVNQAKRHPALVLGGAGAVGALGATIGLNRDLRERMMRRLIMRHTGGG